MIIPHGDVVWLVVKNSSGVDEVLQKVRRTNDNQSGLEIGTAKRRGVKKVKTVKRLQGGNQIAPSQDREKGVRAKCRSNKPLGNGA